MAPTVGSYRTARRSWMPIRGLGAYGVIPDISPYQLPPGAWSDARNVRFTGHAIETLGGERSIYNNLLAEETDKSVYWAYNVVDASDVYWMVAYSRQSAETEILQKIMLGTETAAWEANPTGELFSASFDYLWYAENLGGIIIINNGTDTPYEWTPVKHTRFSVLRNWPETLRCRLLIAYNYYLVALNLLDSSTNIRTPEGVRWSHPAAPGTVPVSWDTTDNRYLAGTSVLPDSGTGEIITAKLLRDWLVIYKNNSVWTMRTVGGVAVFAFSQIFQDFGALTLNSVAAFSHQGGQFHCVFTGDNAIIHDGRSVLQTLDNRMSRYLINNLHDVYWKRSYVFVNSSRQEIWICFPTKQSTTGWPDRVIIWNYAHNILSLAEYHEVPWMTQGQVRIARSPATYSITDWSYPTWKSIPRDVTWKDISKTAQWTPEDTSRPVPVTVGCSVNATNPGLWELDSPDIAQIDKHFHGKAGCYVERTGFGYLPDWRTDEPIQDYYTWKVIKSLRVTYGQSAFAGLNDTMHLTVNGTPTGRLASLRWTPYSRNSTWLRQTEQRVNKSVTDPVRYSVAGTDFTIKFYSTEKGAWRVTDLAFETDRNADQVLHVAAVGGT